MSFGLSSGNWPLGFLSLAFCLLLSPGLAADGDLDSTFGDKGKLLFVGDLRATDELWDVLLQPDGRVVGIGFTIGDTWDVKVARFNADGSFDETFGVGGKQTYDFGGNETGLAGVMLADGKYLIAGEQRVSGDSNVLLMRVDSDGSLDTSFGTAGVVTIEGGYPDDLLLLSDRRIVVGVTVTTSADDDFALVGLQPSGSLDRNFGEDGYVRVDFGREDRLRRLALTLDGRILAAGLSDSGDLLVTLITPGGVLDSAFGSGGKLILTSSVLGAQLGGGSDVGGNFQSVGLAVQLDGKIVVGSGGRGENAPDLDFVLARLNPDGTLDSSFGAGGVSTGDLTGNNDVLGDLAIQADGRIVAVGTVFGDNYPFDPWGHFLIQRYHSDGTPDLGFGTDGWVATDLAEGSGDPDAARSVVIQPDGKILVGGYGPDYDADTSDIALARYLSSVDLAGAFAVLMSSFDMLSPAVRDLDNLLEKAAGHMDRGQLRPALQTLWILHRRVRLLTGTGRLPLEHGRRLLEVLRAIRLSAGFGDQAAFRIRRSPWTPREADRPR